MHGATARLPAGRNGKQLGTYLFILDRGALSATEDAVSILKANKCLLKYISHFYPTSECCVNRSVVFFHFSLSQLVDTISLNSFVPVRPWTSSSRTSAQPLQRVTAIS